MEIGERIRQLRKAQHLSLDELARRSSISRSMLSEIERDTKSPTLRTLSQLATGLNVNLTELLSKTPAKHLALDRASERPTERDPENGTEYQFLAPTWRADGINLIKFHLPAGQSTGKLRPHPTGTQEHLLILSGTLRCRVDDEEFTLETGDALTFTSNQSHEFIALVPEPCIFLLTVNGTRKQGTGR